MHALGFYHEHQRPDRDQFIKIVWSLIPNDYESLFLKMDSRLLNEDRISEYDIDSLMHVDSYGNGYFSKPAATKIDGTVIEPATKLSDLDIITLNKMYPCKDSCGNQRKSFYVSSMF